MSISSLYICFCFFPPNFSSPPGAVWHLVQVLLAAQPLQELKQRHFIFVSFRLVFSRRQIHRNLKYSHSGLFLCLNSWNLSQPQRKMLQRISGGLGQSNADVKEVHAVNTTTLSQPLVLESLFWTSSGQLL